MKNLLAYENMNEAQIPMPSSPKETYARVLAACQKDPKGCLSKVEGFKTTSKEDETDKAMYVMFIKSIIDKSPLSSEDYIGKRLLFNKNLLKLVIG